MRLIVDIDSDLMSILTEEGKEIDMDEATVTIQDVWNALMDEQSRCLDDDDDRAAVLAKIVQLSEEYTPDKEGR